MVIHHPNCLHVCIHDCWANKSEPSFFKVFAEDLGFFCNCWNLGPMLPCIIDWRISHKMPDIGVKTTKNFLYFQKSFGIINSRMNFEFISYDF